MKLRCSTTAGCILFGPLTTAHIDQTQSHPGGQLQWYQNLYTSWMTKQVWTWPCKLPQPRLSHHSTDFRHRVSKSSRFLRWGEMSQHCLQLPNSFSCPVDLAQTNLSIFLVYANMALCPGTRPGQVARLKFFVTGFRGDWKSFVQVFNLCRTPQKDEDGVVFLFICIYFSLYIYIYT